VVENASHVPEDKMVVVASLGADIVPGDFLIAK
jgi:hypothetical protein